MSGKIRVERILIERPDNTYFVRKVYVTGVACQIEAMRELMEIFPHYSDETSELFDSSETLTHVGGDMWLFTQATPER